MKEKITFHYKTDEDEFMSLICKEDLTSQDALLNFMYFLRGAGYHVSDAQLSAVEINGFDALLTRNTINNISIYDTDVLEVANG